ncbi:MAG TPA: ankyrin repeat domain-containing protein [Planctomycetes bacterium]|nr:ankyrin repeat domain-containing protein [Fuerstiella sp.]HIK95280.1 ankyrin repeat domain-containing protein [Planctomycetota bacterium]
MRKLVTGDDLAAMEDAVARDPSSIDRCDESGLPPLYAAARHGNRKAVEFLLQHRAEVDIFACGYLENTTEAEALLEGNRELVRAVTPDGMTALHYAARTGCYDVADMLLRYGADVNACNDKGGTALTEACHGGPWKEESAEDVIPLLLDHDADIDLFTAAAMGRVDLLEKLLDDDSSGIDDVDAKGHTALFVAAHNNRFEAVKFLVQRGADVNRADAVGAAALHRVSQQCTDELIQYLIDNGADAHLCCYVACGDESGTGKALRRNPNSAMKYSTSSTRSDMQFIADRLRHSAFCSITAARYPRRTKPTSCASATTMRSS